ncbi:hypothetical protein KVH31_18050 [Streptomyces olivaceus]|uniref:hypothetical protein n=1 Tax=Streptomyces olivaceus TaxID=47716 RepID=UPI000A43A49F|nr:hypothetical protein [Streptomyces olivaceus]MBZ6208412.1 hypothetical protein [Streptomyces olivaceus]
MNQLWVMTVTVTTVLISPVCPAVLAVAQMSRDGVLPGLGAAIHVARHLPEWGADALVTTVAPKAYEGRGLPVPALNR